ncbi:putative hexose transporter [Thozetella sp. PMI_491]|nr:putative hexose transporter [Thozetella sp. PMI_491]
MVDVAGSKDVKPPKGQFYLAGRAFDRRVWYKDTNMRILYFYIAILIATNTANGFDNSMMNGLQALSYWQPYFDHPTGSILGLFNCVMSVGALCGLLFLPYLMDNWGRKPSIILGSCFMLLGIGLQTGATSFGMFVAARLILGLGDIIVICTAPLLIAEISPAQDRAILVTLAGATYHSGAFIAAWTTYGTLQIQSDWSWRAPSLIQAPFTVMMLLVIWWIPESPRFYIARDLPEKALKILAHYHANGDERDEVVQLEFAEITAAIAMEKAHKSSFGFVDFLGTRGNRRRLLIVICVGLFSQWSGNGLVSYYLTTILGNIGITDPKSQLGINGGLTTFNLVTNVFFSFFVDAWGRRRIQIISTVGMLVSFVIWTILSARYSINPEDGIGKGVMVMIFLYSLAYNMKSGLIASYTTEILPYNMRAKGYVVMEYALYVTLFFNQYVNSIALDNIQWRYYIFYCVFLLAELLIIYFFFVETKYLALEEITKLFDGDDVAQAAATELEQQGEKGFTTRSAVEAA